MHGKLTQSPLLALIDKEKNRLILNHYYETLNSIYLICLWLHQGTLFKSNLRGIPAGTKKVCCYLIHASFAAYHLRKLASVKCITQLHMVKINGQC